MTTFFLSLLIFLLRFSADTSLALRSLSSDSRQMDRATIYPRPTPLYDGIREASGMAVMEKNKILLHNDSGGDAVLFEVDSNGILRRQIWVTDAKNIDWEELAQDHKNQNLYIGDFGNNSRKRKDLKIYKTENQHAKDSLKSDIINFTYPDNQADTSPAGGSNSDCEAFVYFRDSLYLFTKSALAGNGFTKRYRLPAIPGNYQAELIDSFYINNFVTAADISPDGKHLALLSYGNIYIFSHFPGNSFFDGNLLKINIPLSQAEAISFADDHTIYYAAEEGFLYKINLNKLDVNYYVVKEKHRDPDLKIKYKNRQRKLKIKLKEKKPAFYTAALYTPTGKSVLSPVILSRKIKISTKGLKPGIYKLEISGAGGVIKEVRLRIR